MFVCVLFRGVWWAYVCMSGCVRVGRVHGYMQVCIHACVRECMCACLLN